MCFGRTRNVTMGYITRIRILGILCLYLAYWGAETCTETIIYVSQTYPFANPPVNNKNISYCDSHQVVLEV